MTPEAEWTHALERQMVRRQVTQAELARSALVSIHSVRNWRRAKVLPSYENGLAVAAALDSEALGNLIRKLRSRTCETCGRDFIVKSMKDARYCDIDACRQITYAASRQQYMENRQRKRTRRVGRRLTIYQRAIGELCRRCSGDICGDAECPIQVAGLSPLPLPSRPETIRTAEPGLTQSQIMKRRWADPEAREKLVAASRANAALGRIALANKDPRKRESVSAAMRGRWEDPAYRETKRRAGGRPRIHKEGCRRPARGCGCVVATWA